MSEQKAVQIGRTVFSFNDSSLSKFFDREVEPDLPMFGKLNDISENIDMPNQDHIQTPVPHFSVHENTSVMRGIALPRNMYRGNHQPDQNQPFNRRLSSQNNEGDMINYLGPIIIEPETPHRGNSFGR